MRALQRGFREEDAVVGEDANRIAVEVREAADQCRSEKLLELVERAAVHQPGDDLAHLIGLARIGRYDAVKLGGVIERIAWLGDREIMALRPEIGSASCRERVCQ